MVCSKLSRGQQNQQPFSIYVPKYTYPHTHTNNTGSIMSSHEVSQKRDKVCMARYQQPNATSSRSLININHAPRTSSRTSSTHQNEEFTMNKHATRHRGRHYYNRTAIYWHLIVVVSPMATHAGLFTTARAPFTREYIVC